jgi:flagellar biosynthesis chaperone FliJ
MRKGIVENYKRKLEEMEAEKVEKARQVKAEAEMAMQMKKWQPEIFYDRHPMETAEAVEYLKKCAQLINIDASNKDYIVTCSFPLESIPHWEWKQNGYSFSDDTELEPILEAELDILQKALREFIPMVQILYDCSDESFELNIPTDEKVSAEIAQLERSLYQDKCDLAAYEQEIAGYEHQLEQWREKVAKIESNLQEWKRC